MFGIVIASHGTLSQGLIDSVDVIFGNTEGLVACVLKKGQAIEELGDDIAKAIQTVNQGDGVLILTDLLSASPYNQSLMTINGLEDPLKSKCHVLSGVNLPMLIEAVNQRLIGTSIEEAIESIQTQATSGISHWHISQLAEETTLDEDGFDDDF